jgi:hypothetical protein
MLGCHLQDGFGNKLPRKPWTASTIRASEHANPFPFLVINLVYIPPESRMPVAVLPAELWLNILVYEDNDKCHLWFAVRRVSRDFQYYAEKILAVPTIAQASITIHVSQTQIRR